MVFDMRGLGQLYFPYLASRKFYLPRTFCRMVRVESENSRKFVIHIVDVILKVLVARINLRLLFCFNSSTLSNFLFVEVKYKFGASD